MTAEIGILNRSGVALAADSAVTIGNEEQNKVFNTANKLFTLSKWHPIGIMVYANADFMGVPWETIIKVYRERLGGEKKDYLLDYANDFIDFIKNNEAFVTKESECAFVERKFRAHLDNILHSVNQRINDIFKTTTPEENEVESLLYEEIISYSEYLEDISELPSFDKSFRKKFLKTYSDTIVNIIKKVIRIELDEKIIQELLKVAANIFSKNIFTTYTGVVIAGFGEKQIFPSLYQYDFEGIVCGKLRYKLKITREIGAENSRDKTTAAIIPFAQQEMVHSFVEGIDPYLKGELERALKSVFGNFPQIICDILEACNSTTKLTDSDKETLKNNGNEIAKFILKRIGEFQEKQFVAPLLNIVAILPKEELVAIAEALINLTSIKRRMSIDLETVGGPIDVAVITKGDGFVWIRRKHYFRPELNYGFLEKYLRGDKNA